MTSARHPRRAISSFLVLSFLLLVSLRPNRATSAWTSLAPGMDYINLPAKHSSSVGDSRIFILRIDPNLWQLEAIGISQTADTVSHTARQWSQLHNFSAAINAGMFATDIKTHVGYMGSDAHVNNGKLNSYQSVAAFAPRDAKTSPPFRIFDLDEPGVSFAEIQRRYASSVQNLRLIKRPGLNQWPQQEKKWSEAALGEDDRGRILFIYSRSPFSMHDLNDELLSSGIGIVAAQHLEGGPEPQLYLHVGSTEMEMYGSYETNFKENESNPAPWPIPNILAVRPRSTR